MKSIIRFVSLNQEVVRVYAANVDLAYFTSRQWHDLRSSFFDFYKSYPGSKLEISVIDNTPF